MEENEIEAQVRKFPRIGNGEEDGEVRTTNRFHSWHHHSSRIIRVSRASGGKDRHSKVMTSKGLRDRRVRLSVTTAIQFYDLQDRLGYDQPSKAVEWLIKSASDSIAELPSLNTTFPETPKENRGNEQGFDGESENENENGNNNYDQQQQNNNDVNNQSQNMSLSKSACSSTSETSKGSGSGLSLSRSDTRVNRVKARERARERTAKEKEKEKKKDNNNNNNESHNVNPISQTASFTELLTGGISNVVAIPTTASPGGCDEPNNMFNKAGRQQWCASTPMDYFLGPSSYRTHRSHNHHHHHQSSVSQIQVGHSLHEAMNVSAFNNMSGENQQQSSSSNPNQMQHLSFISDHLMPAVVTSSSSCASHQHDQASGNNDYNLNFTMSSGLAGYNRGTLQSNSPSLLPQMQRFSPIDGSTVPFLIGAAPSAAVTPMENNNHHLSSVFDGGHLQLYYADGCRHSDRKGKTKN